MIRLIIEGGLVFIAPALIYLAWRVVQKRAERGDTAAPLPIGREIGEALDGAPYVWLFVAGALLVLFMLLSTGTPSGGSPDQHYEPARIENGKVKQGHFE